MERLLCTGFLFRMLTLPGLSGRGCPWETSLFSEEKERVERGGGVCKEGWEEKRGLQSESEVNK